MRQPDCVGRTVELHECTIWDETGETWEVTGKYDVVDWTSDNFGSGLILSPVGSEANFFIDYLPDVVQFTDELMPNIKAVIYEVGEAYLESAMWLDDLLNRRFGC